MESDDIPLTATAERLESAMDRMQEAHFFLHGLEEYYHAADPFRWHLNAFLRALKEVPQLTAMALQNVAGFPAWYRPRREALATDPLIRHLAEQRDYVVHRGMLKPSSSAMLGITRGRGIKLGMGVPLDPMIDSDSAMRRFVEAIKTNGDFLGVLLPDDSTIPCIERHWGLPEFPKANLVDLCADAWIKVAGLLRDVYEWTGVELSEPGLSCRHDSAQLRLRVYPREKLAAGDYRGYRLPPPEPPAA